MAEIEFGVIPAATVNLITTDLLPGMMVDDFSDGGVMMTAGAPGKTYYAASNGDMQRATMKKGQEISAKINEFAPVGNSIGWELTNLRKCGRYIMQRPNQGTIPEELTGGRVRVVDAVSAERSMNAVTRLKVPDAKMLVAMTFIGMTMIRVKTLDVKARLNTVLKKSHAGAGSGPAWG